MIIAREGGFLFFGIKGERECVCGEGKGGGRDGFDMLVRTQYTVTVGLVRIFV